MNQVTLPLVVIIIITQKWNSKSKVKVLKKDIEENAATILSETGGQNLIECGPPSW